MRSSTSGEATPWVARMSASSSSDMSANVERTCATLPSGLVSVMPQACRIGMPSFSR
jgi:hypothetical protein